MNATKTFVAVLLALTAGACVTTETVSFQPGPKQQSMVRDGKNALVSTQGKSIVLVSPSSRGMSNGERPVFVVGINNITRQPIDFRMEQVSVVQLEKGQPKRALRVVTYENLVKEEKSRQVAVAILTGLTVGVNAYNASQAGYQHHSGTVRTTTYAGGRSYHSTGYVSGTTYSPALAAAANAQAQAQNAAMIDRTVSQGQANLAELENTVIKDHTLLPGEWYGGALHFEAPLDDETGGAKAYAINVTVGGEVHTIQVTQTPTKS